LRSRFLRAWNSRDGAAAVADHTDDSLSGGVLREKLKKASYMVHFDKVL